MNMRDKKERFVARQYEEVATAPMNCALKVVVKMSAGLGCR